MAMANVVLRVEGEVVGTQWVFLVSILVHDLQTDTWRAATAGEAHVKLIEVRWGILPDRLLDEKNTDSSGKAPFNAAAYYSAGRYRIEAEHNVSHDTAGVLITCEEDGSWWIEEAYTP